MSKLKDNVLVIIKNDPDYRKMVADSIGIGERAVIQNLQNNIDNGPLTKYNALYCIKKIVKVSTIDELLIRDMSCE